MSLCRSTVSCNSLLCVYRDSIRAKHSTAERTPAKQSHLQFPRTRTHKLPSSSIVFTLLSALTVYHLHQLLNLAAMDSFTDILSTFSSSASASVKPSIVSHKTEEEVQVPVEEESNISNSTYCVVA